MDGVFIRIQGVLAKQVNIVAFLHQNVGPLGSPVRLAVRKGPNGVLIPIAFPRNGSPDPKEDSRLKLFGRDGHGREQACD
ncbi:MAG: hypothetical protein QOF70_183 [Acetobacteraceae bacterium]|jgi:hypothetical protein|nr:hypothetical protein [Acetobacteraceae bacterium]